MSEQPHPEGVRLLPWQLPGWLIDALLISIAMVGFFGRPLAEDGTIELVDWVALAVGVVLLLTRRLYPLPTLAVAVVASVTLLAISARPSVLMPVALAALFTVALNYERRTAIMAGTITTFIFGVTVIALLQGGEIDGAGLAAIAWPAFAIAAGAAIRSTRQNVAAAQERARRAEESRELEARRRVVEERLRIARDVHDLVAHHIAVINVQAGVAGHLIESDPPAAGEALGAVRGAAATVVDQLGELLGVLRTADEAGEPTAPTPDLAAIDDLISSFAVSGLSVQRETSGAPRPLSALAELTAYRVVQEALTNAHKYGDGTATVTLRFDDEGLEVAVANPTSDSAPEGSGFGLIGMRERVEAIGGCVEAGVSPDGRRFEIAAAIPAKDHE